MLPASPGKRSIGAMEMAIAFMLGIANFAAQRAVLKSGHPMLRAIPARAFRAARLASLALEFALLVAAMLMVRGGQSGWLWLYAGYSITNGGAAWAIANRRI